jgi:hypothetical protein
VGLRRNGGAGPARLAEPDLTAGIEGVTAGSAR